MHWIVGCVDPRVGLEALRDKKSVACDRKLQCSVPDISLMLYGTRMSTCYKLWSIGVLYVCLLPPPIPSSLLKPPDYVWVMARTHHDAHSCNFREGYIHWRFKMSGKWWNVAGYAVPVVLKESVSSAWTAVAQWLRCCATNRKVTGSIPAGVSGFFIDIKSFRSHYGPGVDSASNRNEYQEHFLGVKAVGA